MSKHCSPPVHVLWGMDPWAIPSILVSVGDVVILKFDMHANPSVLSSDEVNSLVAEYAIPSYLHPCVPPSGLTMNRLPADKIDRHAISDAMPWRHQDSSIADPSPTGVRAEYIHRLCENVINLRPVHSAMLYVVGLTTIWKHVGHHPVFKDGEGNVAMHVSILKFRWSGRSVGKGTTLAANEVIPQHTTPPLPSGSQIPEKSDHQRVVEVENERVLAAKRKAQIAKDKAVGKKAAEGVSHRTKKRKTTPLSFALSDSEADDSNRSGSELALLLWLFSEATFPARHPGGDGAGSSIRRDAGHDDTVRSQNQLSEDHKAFQQVHLGCVEKEADLVEKLAAMEKERDDLLDRDREREERIQRLEADLASKTSSLAEAEGVIGTLRGDLERLTVDLSQAEIVRHNYVRQLLPAVVQRLLSSGEYKKSLTDVFNLAIAAGWSKGVKATCSEEEAQAFLATAVDYDPACKETFMTEFDSLFDKSYPYVEKLAESFRLPLGDLQNMWPEGTGPTLSGNAVGASTTADASYIADASDVAEAQ
ncbi:hypothetical protein Tco_1204825 [Tanacetum coccineum]